MTTVAIIGLGYVGLPLAIEFGRHFFRTIGLDRDAAKIRSYRECIDPAREVPPAAFEAARKLTFTDRPQDIGEADVIIIAVPTPVDGAHRPDFGSLLAASRTCGSHHEARRHRRL